MYFIFEKRSNDIVTKPHLKSLYKNFNIVFQFIKTNIYIRFLTMKCIKVWGCSSILHVFASHFEQISLNYVLKVFCQPIILLYFVYFWHKGNILTAVKQLGHYFWRKLSNYFTGKWKQLKNYIYLPLGGRRRRALLLFLSEDNGFLLQGRQWCELQPSNHNEFSWIYPENN